MLHAEGFENDGALDFAIKKLETSLKKSKKKDGDEEPVSLAALLIPDYPHFPPGGARKFPVGRRS
jgi:hypothetical protein